MNSDHAIANSQNAVHCNEREKTDRRTGDIGSSLSVADNQINCCLQTFDRLQLFVRGDDAPYGQHIEGPLHAPVYKPHLLNIF